MESASNTDEAPQTARRKSVLRRVLPYIGTLALLTYLYFDLRDQFSSDAFMSALSQANFGLLAVGMMVPFVMWLLLNITLTSFTFTWFITPLKIGDIWSVRGASLLGGVINPVVAGGVWVLYLMRKTGASLIRVFAMRTMNVASFLTWLHVIVTVLFVLMLTGGYRAHVEDSTVFKLGLGVVVGWLGLVHFYTFWLWSWPRIHLLDRLRSWTIFEAWNRANARQWAVILGMMMPLVAAGFVGQWLCAQSFGIDIPFEVFSAHYFLVMLYLFIPAVGHVGPLTAGWLVAFEGMASAEVLTACTIAVVVMGHLLRMTVGLTCLIPAKRELSSVRSGEGSVGL